MHSCIKKLKQDGLPSVRGIWAQKNFNAGYDLAKKSHLDFPDTLQCM